MLLAETNMGQVFTLVGAKVFVFGAEHFSHRSGTTNFAEQRSQSISSQKIFSGKKYKMTREQKQARNHVYESTGRGQN